MKAYSDQDALADVAASVAVLRARPEVGGNKVGSFGYCMGGRMAYVAAATARVDAAVAFYGGGIHNQLERAVGIECPIQFHYAERDDNIPPQAVEAVRGALAARLPRSTSIPARPTASTAGSGRAITRPARRSRTGAR